MKTLLSLPFIRHLSFFVLIAFLPGCVSLLPKPSTPPKEFTLGGAQREISESKKQKPYVVKITKTIAATPLQAQHILILTEKGDFLESDYLADAIWHEPLADLVQCRLIEELRARQLFKGVGHNHEAFRPDLLYLPALHHFEIVKDSSGQYRAVVTLSIREVTFEDRCLKRERVFRDERPVPASLDGFISGLNHSFLKVLEDAVSWIEDSK